MNKDTYNTLRKIAGLWDDVKHTVAGFKPRHLVPDWLASTVFNDYTPGNVDSATSLETRNSTAGKNDSIMARLRSARADAGNVFTTAYNPKSGVATFTPVSDNPVQQNIRFLHGNTKLTPQQLNAMIARVKSAEQARMAHGVPAAKAPYYMNYDKAKVDSYSDLSTNAVYKMPEMPEAWNEEDYYGDGGPAHYVINPEASYSYAYTGDPKQPGMLDGRFGPFAGLPMFAHEGFLKYLGHYGSRSTKPMSTDHPRVTDRSKLAGMPYYSMSASSVGGILGEAARSGDYDYWVAKFDDLVGPTEPGEVYKNIVANNKGPVNNYDTSPVEFGADSSIIKTVAAGQGRTDLNKFDPDNPDQFLKNFDEVTSAAARGESSDGSKLHPDVGRRMRELVLSDDVSSDAIRAIFQRYTDLHNKLKAGKQLNRAEMNEYLHYRKSLPSIWDQANNRRTGVLADPYGYTAKGIPT